MSRPVPSAPEPTPEQPAQQAADQKLEAARALVNDLLDQNKDVDAIVRILQKKGFAHDEAAVLVSNVVLERTQELLGTLGGSEPKNSRREALRKAAQATRLQLAQHTADELDDAYTLINEELDQNRDAEEIIPLVEEQGFSHDEAVALVSEVVSGRAQVKAYRKALRKAGEKNQLVGGLFFLVGTVVTVGSYAAAAGGGTYTVAAGAIIFGAIQYFRGLGQVLQANRLQ